MCTSSVSGLGHQSLGWSFPPFLSFPCWVIPPQEGPKAVLALQSDVFRGVDDWWLIQTLKSRADEKRAAKPQQAGSCPACWLLSCITSLPQRAGCRGRTQMALASHLVQRRIWPSSGATEQGGWFWTLQMVFSCVQERQMCFPEGHDDDGGGGTGRQVCGQFRFWSERQSINWLIISQPCF